MTEIVTLPPNKLKPADRKILRDAGFVVIELDDPNDLRVVHPHGPEIDSSELLWAALDALDKEGYSATTKKFVSNLRAIAARKLAKREGVEASQ